MRGRRRLARAAGWLSLAATVFAGGALAAPSSTAVAPVRVALVVGHNAPIDASTEPLRYADDDAVAWQRLLTEAGVEARLLTVLDEETRTLHPDLDAEPPTLAAVELALRGLFAELATARSRGARTELTLIYSGHGEVAGGEGVVALQGGRLTRTHLRQLLAESPADHNHVVIDACKSYFMAFAKGPGGERVALEPGALAAVDLDRSRTGFLLSTSSDRASHEWERFRAGIFSHQLRSALRGAADADVDGRLTYAEVGAFLSSANAGIDNTRYRPDFLVAPPAEAPATRAELLRWADAPGLVADDFAWGHAYLEDTHGHRLVDFHPARGQRIALRLPAERPLFVRRANDTEEWVLQEPGPAPFVEERARPMPAGERGALHLAFSRLFEQPFSAADVASWSPPQEVAVVRADVEEGFDVPWLRLGASGAAVAGGLGIACAGLGLHLWAYERSLTPAVSQQDAAARNQTIVPATVGAFALYGVGAAVAVAGAVVPWILPAPDGD